MRIREYSRRKKKCVITSVSGRSPFVKGFNTAAVSRFRCLATFLATSRAFLKRHHLKQRDEHRFRFSTTPLMYQILLNVPFQRGRCHRRLFRGAGGRGQLHRLRLHYHLRYMTASRAIRKFLLGLSRPLCGWPNGRCGW